MSQCGVNIPLDDIVEAIIDNYGDAFALEIIKRLDARCDRDNHVTKFYIDKEKDHLVVELKFGERYYVSRAELEDWLKIAAGGIKSGVLILQATTPTQVIRVTNKDGSIVDIDVSALVPSNSPYIVSGVFVERNSGYWLDFTSSDGTKVEVDMTAIIQSIMQTVYDRVMRTGYRLNTQAGDYTITGEDFNGRTLVRADKAGDMSVTIAKPLTEDFIGLSVTVRKTSGDAGTFTTLVAGAGVTLSPPDATILRRVGGSATLVYTGGGNWDIFGELP